MLLTVDRHDIVHRFTGIFLRVLVDGQDVTDRCASADDDTGWALCYRLNEQGRKFQEGGKAAAEVLTGKVVFVRRADKD